MTLKNFKLFLLIYFQILLTRLQEVERVTESFKMESTLFHLQWLVLVLECCNQTRMWRSSWSQRRILWKPNGRSRRSRLASTPFYKFLISDVHIWAPFFCGPVSPCIHVPVVGHSSTVISSLWLGVALVERGLASLTIQWYLLEGHGAKQES